MSDLACRPSRTTWASLDKRECPLPKAGQQVGHQAPVPGATAVLHDPERPSRQNRAARHPDSGTDHGGADDLMSRHSEEDPQGFHMRFILKPGQ